MNFYTQHNGDGTITVTRKQPAIAIYPPSVVVVPNDPAMLAAAFESLLEPERDFMAINKKARNARSERGGGG